MTKHVCNVKKGLVYFSLFQKHVFIFEIRFGTNFHFQITFGQKKYDNSSESAGYFFCQTEEPFFLQNYKTPILDYCNWGINLWAYFSAIV